MIRAQRMLISGNEAVALAAYDAGVALGCRISRHAVHGNPGEPSPIWAAGPSGRPTRRSRWRWRLGRPSAGHGRW